MAIGLEAIASRLEAIVISLEPATAVGGEVWSLGFPIVPTTPRRASFRRGPWPTSLMDLSKGLVT